MMDTVDRNAISSIRRYTNKGNCFRPTYSLQHCFHCLNTANTMLTIKQKPVKPYMVNISVTSGWPIGTKVPNVTLPVFDISFNGFFHPFLPV